MPSTATRTPGAAPIRRLRVNFMSRSSPTRTGMRWMSVLRRQYTLSRPIVRSVLRRFPGGAHAALAAALLVSLCTNVAAPAIPGDVTLQAWLKPEGQRLRLLVRVPLVAMRDMNYPTRGDKTLG